ncbi:MAG: AAA family ATPase, partial [Planctomycetales bacterium]
MNDFLPQSSEPQSSSPQSSEPQPTGPLEFRCTDCGQLLRVDNVPAGHHVRCPQCQQTMQVPAESARNSLVDSPALPEAAPATHIPQTSSAVTGIHAIQPAVEVRQQPSSENARRTRELFDRITQQTSKIFIGQQDLVQGTLVALFSGGHVLIESVPGLGKTLFIRTLGQVLGCKFGRIQFTADLMPSDITGAPIFNMKTQDFDFRPGPVFTQLLLADEINRSPAKTHAALLEIMQEYHVTVDGVSHQIERPFLVMATQNPIESEGTYNLPEAQLDRFMFKLVADYPDEQEEADVLRLHREQLDLDRYLEEEVETVVSPAEILEVTTLCRQVRVDDKLL